MSEVVKEPSPRDPEFWGGATDPATHDPTQFRYLVHAVNPFAKMSALTTLKYDKEDGRIADSTWGDQSINMYDEPERIAERVSLSMSLIDQDHTGTWGNCGLIVGAPEGNILVTGTTDIGSHNSNLDILRRQSDNNGHVMDGDTLLRLSSPTIYNEVVAIANQNGEQIQLEGFFYKTTSSGEILDEAIVEHMKAHAERLGLPIVAIPIPSQFGKDEVIRTESYSDKQPQVAVHFNGRRYLLNGFNEIDFNVIDEKYTSRFAAPDEIEAVLGFAVESQSITETEAAQLADTYRATDKKRQTPTAEFDEDGSFKMISYREGYGLNETEIALHKSGSSNRTNLAQQSEQYHKLFGGMASGGPIKIMDPNEANIHTPISAHEAKAMVDEACKHLDDAKAAELRQWYAEHREVVERQYRYHQGKSRP